MHYGIEQELLQMRLAEFAGEAIRAGREQAARSPRPAHGRLLAGFRRALRRGSVRPAPLGSAPLTFPRSEQQP